MRFVLALLIACQLFFTDISISAQSIWLPGMDEPYIGLEFLKPSFDTEDDFTFFTQAIILSGYFRTSESVVIVAEAPMMHVGVSSRSVINFQNIIVREASETGLGNIYLGLEAQIKESQWSIEVGLRAPTAPEDNILSAVVGVLTAYDRFEAYVPNILTMGALANVRQPEGSRTLFRFRAGPSLIIPTGDEGETDLLLSYSGQVGFQGKVVSLLGGISGKLFITQENLDFNERAFHHLTIAANFDAGAVQPGLLLRLPMSDVISQVLDTVIGLQVGIRLE